MLTNVSIKYFNQVDGYHVYNNVINTQTNKQLTQTDLKNILSSYNIEFNRNGAHYDINTKNQLDLGNNSIILQKYVDCYKPGFLFDVVYDFSSNPAEKDLISTIEINTYMFPPGVDPKKINSISFYKFLI